MFNLKKIKFLKDRIEKLQKENENFKKSLNAVIKIFNVANESKIDYNAFKTQEVFAEFIVAVNDKSLMESLDSEQSKYLYNVYLTKDKIYAEVIEKCIDFCKNKKNKSSAIYKQLHNNFMRGEGEKL